MEDFRDILERAVSGGGRTDELLERMYGEMRSVADRLMSGERAHHTLQPTALVHEAYLRLLGGDNVRSMDRLQFLDAAAVSMRRILIDHARGRGAEKRGGAWDRVTLQGMTEDEAGEEFDVVRLHQALEKLEALDPRQAKIVELRFFAGMTGQEIADHLDVSRNTVVRELTFSRAWLERELSDD